MSILSKDSLISRSVYLYYRENLNIQEISDRLGISRFRVSRYLKEAEETGMVTIQINDRDCITTLGLHAEKYTPSSGWCWYPSTGMRTSTRCAVG